MKLPVWTVVLVILLAGCASQVDRDDFTTSTTTTSSIPESSPPPPPGIAANATVPLAITWYNCKGAETVFTWPGATGPGETPPGWEGQSPGAVGSDVFLLFMECSRIAWGPFERGPIRMIWELHNHFLAPASCAHAGKPVQWLLASLWTDDAELSMYAQATYGAPAWFSPILADYDNTAARREVTWAWGTANATQSNVSISEYGSTPNGVSLVDVIGWAHDDANMTLLRLDHRSANALGQQVVAAGTMQPPMLYAQSGLTTYAGIATYLDELEVSATMQRFGDLQCERPLP